MPLNPSATAIFKLGDTLKHGLSSLGDRPLEQAKFDLNKAQIMQQVNDPRAKLGRVVAQQRLDFLNEPITLGMFTPTLESAAHWIYRPGDDEGGTPGVDRELSMAQKFPQMWGAGYKWDTDERSPTFKQLIGPDGEPIRRIHTMSDGNDDKIRAFIVANTGLDHALDSQENELQRALSIGKIDEETFKQKMFQINEVRKRPDYQMKLANSKVEFLSRFIGQGDEFFNSDIKKGVDRWQKKYNSASAMLEKQNQRKWEKEKLQIQESGKDRRAGAKAFKYSASDSNAIGRQIQRLFDVDWMEDSQNYEGGSQEDRNKAANVQSRAEEIYMNSKGKKTHAQAVKEAASEFGFEFKKSQKDVDSFIDTQLGRYDDLTKKQPKEKSKEEMPLVRGRTESAQVFDVEGSGYDYKMAEQFNVKPDATGHWPSRVELTPVQAKELGLPAGSGIILKGRNHETFDKTIAAEKEAGYQVIKLEGRYYSIPASEDLGEVVRQHQIKTSPRINIQMPKVGPIPSGQGLPR